MLSLQAFKFELIPNGEPQRNMRRFAGSYRFVYNHALALQKANHEAGKKFIGYVAMAKRLTEWRNSLETPWGSSLLTAQAVAKGQGGGGCQQTAGCRPVAVCDGKDARRPVSKVFGAR